MDGGIGSGLIVGGIFKLMEVLYRSVEGAAANRELCESLALRVKVIEGAIKALEVTPLRGYALASPLTQLQTTLQSAVMLVKEQSSKSKVLLFLQGSTVRARFDELHRRLSQCQIDLSIPFEADTRAALQSIMQQQQDTAAQIEALAETIATSLPAQVAAAIKEGLARRRAFPAPGHAVPPAASPMRDGTPEPGTVANASLRQEDARPAWLLDYDALHFELDKRGRRRELGRGATAVVYRALYFGQPVAVKVLSAAAAGLHDPAHRGVFDRELQTCFALRHPNIAPVIGGTAPTSEQLAAVASGALDEADVPEFAIVMEQEATSLAAAASGLSPEQKLSVLKGVASALVYLHVARPKIVHCDLKPANVLLGADGTAKLTDFGVAATRATVANNTNANGSSGDGRHRAGGWTEAYAAPEVMRNPSATPDERADVYSFGALVKELFAGDAAAPPAIDAIAAACLRDAAAERPYAADLVAALAAPAEDLLSGEDPSCALGTRLPAVILRAPIVATDGKNDGVDPEEQSVRARLRRFYAHYAPEKVANIDNVLRMYDGRYPDMFERLVAKYGPEPGASPTTAGARSESPTSFRGGAAEQQRHQALRDRLTRFYVRYDSGKLGNVDEIIARFHDVEGDLFARLVEKYGPEPPADRAAATDGGAGNDDVEPVAAQEDNAAAAAHPPTKARDATVAAPAPPASSTDPKSNAGCAESTLPGAPPEKSATEVAQALVRPIPEAARVQLLQFYEYHAPDKVRSVDKVLTRFAGREDELFATLAVLYGSGPELVPAESGL
uniref:Protein kinase domain-containing protein n=1 Tax=Neobodo designis TaxID=312471 RepID=A0A7S1MSY2_NEODS|mmetsp:Transcript_46364/g.143061  ORF Transcript_46364/g.143061 Transcript_46364/m.143061 type:complete len:789 (+) Transcript_46364:216-2582(+)